MPSPVENESRGTLNKLILAIESKDIDVICTIFDEIVDEDVIRQLPLPQVSPLLTLLRKKVARKSVKSINHLDWISCLIRSKLDYLISSPNIDSEISFLQEALNTKMDVFDRVIQLQGKLDLLMAQINRHEFEKPRSASYYAKMPAKVTFIDPDESEDEEVVDEDEEDAVKANHHDDNVEQIYDQNSIDENDANNPTTSSEGVTDEMSEAEDEEEKKQENSSKISKRPVKNAATRTNGTNGNHASNGVDSNGRSNRHSLRSLKKSQHSPDSIEVTPKHSKRKNGLSNGSRSKMKKFSSPE